MKPFVPYCLNNSNMVSTGHFCIDFTISDQHVNFFLEFLLQNDHQSHLGCRKFTQTKLSSSTNLEIHWKLCVRVMVHTATVSGDGRVNVDKNIISPNR